ncbi:MAG: His-Xaa-Ser system radical SAM maturase HxsB [Myxococcales bacterium]|nr:His-Xaa-Ser system radical SAM maturase HxsB [Myxococcales bacterium]
MMLRSDVMPSDLVPLSKKPTAGLLPVRFRRLGDAVLLTTPFGDWAFVSPEELTELRAGKLEQGSELETRLAQAGLLANQVDPARLAAKLRAKKRFLQNGPHLHVLVVTLRCNETCVYCHASRASMDRVDTDMSKEMAEQVVDMALSTTSPHVTLEFQGGEPLVNFPVVQHVIEVARRKNQKIGKSLEFSLVSNLSLMNDERLDYLVENRVQICTSIDGPEALHDKQRKLPSASAHQAASHWIRRINERYAELGLDPSLYHVEALLTTTRAALDRPREIVDAYLELGCRAIFLRPVDPFGFASATRDKIEYPREEYLEFYRKAVDYIIELNKQGTQVLERFAAIFLTKILTAEDPNYLDIRSPCGAAIGQLAYNYDGRIFTCDEGRMLHEMGDDTFAIGQVGESRYRDLMRHDVVAALATASNLDAQPDCVNCTYNPYCGVCPVHSYRTQGSIHGRMRESTLCAVHKGIQDYLFDKLRTGDEETRTILRRFTTVRERAHFIQSCAAP